jgi:hypothetical protein
MSLDDALRLIETGELHDAKSLVGLLMYDRMQRQKLGN